MIELAKTDEAMAEMLEKAKVYYLLKQPSEKIKQEDTWARFWDGISDEF